MYKDKSIEKVFLLGTAICVMVMGFIPTAVGAEEESEIFKITVGEPTFMSQLRYQNLGGWPQLACSSRKPGFSPGAHGNDNV